MEAVDRGGVGDECTRVARGRAQHGGIAPALDGEWRVVEQLVALPGVKPAVVVVTGLATAQSQLRRLRRP